MATPWGAKASYWICSKAAPSLSSPVPRRMARSMFSLGMLLARARSIARRRLKFESRSPPPSRAAMAISRASRVNMLPRRASLAAFLRLMVDHLEWPDMPRPSLLPTGSGSADCAGPGIDRIIPSRVSGPPERGASGRCAGLRQDGPQLPQRLQALAAVVVVGVGQHKWNARFQLLQAGYPLAQLLFAIGIVVTLPGLLMIPPLGGVPAVETDIPQRSAGPDHGRHQTLQLRLVDAAVPQLKFSQQLEGLILNPGSVAELNYDRQIGQPLPERLQVLSGLLPGVEREGDRKSTRLNSS